MGYSSLATIKIWSPNNSGKRNHTIDSVAIHTMAGDLDATTCGNLFALPGTQASSNYGVDSNGVIGVYVDEDNRSWCTSNSGVDHRAVTIEVASTTASEPYACTDAAYESLIKLLVDICQRNNIKGLKWANNSVYAVAAANGGPVDDQNMFVHRWFESKSCPGEYLFGKQAEIANEVNSRLNNGYSAQGVSSSATSTSSTSGGGVSISIDYSEFDPYIITLTRDSRDVPYKKLIDNRVVGAIVEAGYMFTPQHRKVDKFESPVLDKQIKNLEALNDPHGMPYALMMYARARTAQEAKDEIYWFSFPLRRYSPEIGVWLQLELGTNKKTNDTIMEAYNEELNRLGYSQKKGIICSRKTLDYISWDKYKSKFALDLVNHIKDTNELDKLMDPEFFDVDMTKKVT